MLISEHLHPTGVLSSNCVNSDYGGWKIEWVVTGFINCIAETDGWKIHRWSPLENAVLYSILEYMDLSGTICVVSRPTGRYRYCMLKCLRLILHIKKKKKRIENFNSLSEYFWIYQSICSLNITMPTKPTRSVSYSLTVNLLLYWMLLISSQREKFTIWH